MEARALMPKIGWQDFARSADRALEAPAPGGTTASWDGTFLALRSGAALCFSESLSWNPKLSLAQAAARLASSAVSSAESASALIGATILQAHADGRPALGIYGDGPFASGFRRLAGYTSFPANLVGFGTGLTPAGDDWLAGFLVAADLVSGGPGIATDYIRRSIRASLDRTTAAGRSLLLGALDGSPPAYLVELAVKTADLAVPGEEPLGHDAKEHLRMSVTAALKHGATSGEDALLGFIAGLHTGVPLAFNRSLNTFTSVVEVL